MSLRAILLRNLWIASLGVVAVVALAACAGGQKATAAVDDTSLSAGAELSHDEIAGISPALAAYADQKRRPDDPIYINMAPTVWDRKFRATEKSKWSIAQHVRDELGSDPIIQILPDPKLKIGRKTSQPVSQAVDVEVASTISIKEVLGPKGGAGKSNKTIRVVFEATITSQAPPVSYVVSDSGPVQQQRAVSKRFARQIRDVIVEQIGPEIPAR